MCMVYICFSSFIPTPWIFACSGFSAVSSMYSLLRDLLRYWGLFFSDVFVGGSEVVGKCFWYFPHELDCLSCPIFMGVYAIVTGSLTIWPLVWSSLCGVLLVPLFLLMTGAPNLLSRTALRLQSVHQEVTPCLPFSLSHDRESLDGLSSILSNGTHFCGRIYSCSMMRRG